MFVFSHSMIAEKVIDWKYAKAHMKISIMDGQTSYDDYKNIFIHLHLLSIIIHITQHFFSFFRAYANKRHDLKINKEINNLPIEGIM